MAGAFYPNYFFSSRVDERVALKEVGGLDPLTTVTVQGVPSSRGHLFGDQIISLFKTCGKVKRIEFASTRAFIEFERPDPIVSGYDESSSVALKPVVSAVYCAIKMRKLRIPLEFVPIQKKRTGSQKETAVVLGEEEAAASRLRPPAYVSVPSKCSQVKLPDSLAPFLKVVITTILDAGHLWAVFADDDTTKLIRALNENIQCLKPIHDLVNPLPGQLCLSLYKGDGLLYRARILQVDETSALIQFLEYGNTELVSRFSLKKLPQGFHEYPAQAFECYLARLKPSYSRPIQNWTTVAKERLSSLVGNKILYAKIYSKVDNAIRLELIDTSTADDILISQVLIQEGHAESAPEPLNSEMARESALREATAFESLPPSRPPASANPTTTGAEMFPSLRWDPVSPLLTRLTLDDHPPPVVHLKGPTSPLEMRFCHIPAVGQSKEVRIHRGSVNSVSLNEFPGEANDRLMVSSNVRLSPFGDTIMADNTTILPKIPGLPALLTILFAPVVEMRCDENRRIYVGVIAGLGFNRDTGKPLLPEHDIDLLFDFTFTQQDLANVNDIRHAIGVALGSESRVSSWCMDDVRKIQNATRIKILGLIRSTRSEQTCPHSTADRYRWNQIPSDFVLAPPMRSAGFQGDRAFLYELHSGIRLMGGSVTMVHEKRVKMLRMQQHLDDLKRLAGLSDAKLELKCQLCEKSCSSARTMWDHLLSPAHQTVYQAFLDRCK
eukprot:m.125981 g.125981  ORF g.125981 m.125981 type:complete len:723 (+) comp37886_c0_seq5:2-2170(+)